eukprot:m.332870 g.332870  ORF g.332870 m.332870 type:complete len:112 (+) comp17018_c0_seq1:48-383(+)
MASGIPLKLLHEAEGHIVTCELITGETYRGKLVEAEDNMNAQFVDITYTDRTNRTLHLESVYIRGSKIRFLSLPDMLKNAPMFKNQKKLAGGVGRGKSAILRAQAASKTGK